MQKTDSKTAFSKQAPGLKKQITLKSDDPFSQIFIEPEEIKKQIALKLAACFRQKNEQRMDQMKQMDDTSKSESFQ